MIKTMLTTVDNPHSPFDDFKAWYAHDVSNGHHTCSFLARILNDSDQLSDSDQDFAVALAIEEIMRENVTGIYRKVTKDVSK
ncbi:MAG: hypothetical protein ABWY25_07595 [Paenisporosarcina sp.]